jgi:copper(I)-binding protein
MIYRYCYDKFRKNNEGKNMKKSKLNGIILGLVASVSLFAACGGDDDSSSPATGVEVVDVWARTSPSMTSLGAVYLKMSSQDGDELTDVSVDPSIAGVAELHEMVMANAATDSSMEMTTEVPMDDMSSTTEAMSEEMVMQEVESIVIDAGSTVELKSGSYHIMLIDIVKPLELGAKFDVTLTFAKAGKVTVSAEVRDEAP